jgi:hypothetical protein
MEELVGQLSVMRLCMQIMIFIRKIQITIIVEAECFCAVTPDNRATLT